MYPRICINLNALDHNAKTLLKECAENGITNCFAVVKVLAGDTRVATLLSHHGFSHLADSRIDNLIRYRNLPLPKALLRLPMPSEAARVVRYADLSLNSEWSTIVRLDMAAKRQGKIHEIMLMYDLGDLREGLFYQENHHELIEKILTLHHIRLAGIGTNLTCYGGLIPTPAVLDRLVAIAQSIEQTFHFPLRLISGGNSSSMYLFDEHKIPTLINSLRIGEALMLGRETAYGQPIDGLRQDAFILETQLIEVQTKPSFPEGDIGMNSFGEIPNIIDKGMMKRGIVAIGKQDVQWENLTPIDPTIEIVGASSDHLILDLSKTNRKVGDLVRFHINYPGLLQLMTSRYVHKKYLD